MKDLTCYILSTPRGAHGKKKKLEIKLQSFLDWTYTWMMLSTHSHHIRFINFFLLENLLHCFFHLQQTRSEWVECAERKYQFCNFPFQWLPLLYFRIVRVWLKRMWVYIYMRGLFSMRTASDVCEIIYMCFRYRNHDND